MGNFVVNGNTIKPLDQCWTQGGGKPLAGLYYALDPYGEAPRAGAPEYEELPVTFPGVDGVGLKRFGFRGRDINATICVIGATKAACETTWAAFGTSITQLARYTITMPGGTVLQGCKLTRGGGRLVRWVNFNTWIMGIADCDWRQLSTTN